MSAKTSPSNMPRLGRREDQSEEKKGLIASLLAKLGLGGAGDVAGTGAYNAATVGTSSPFWAGILASKVGITALVLGGMTAAGAVGVVIFNNGGLGNLLAPPSPEDVPGLVFENQVQQKPNNAAATQAPANSNGVSDSLADFRRANSVQSNAGLSIGGVGVQGVSQTPASGQSVPNNANGPSNAGAAVKPAMVAGPSLAGSNSSTSSGAMARLEPQGGLSSGIGNGFQQVYHPSSIQSTPLSAARTTSGVTSRSMLGASGSKAMNQLGVTNQVVGSNLRSPMVSSQGSGVTYDGGSRTSLNSTAGGGIQGGGLGVTGNGMSNSPTALKANPANPTNSVPSVPPVGSSGNATPWQWAQNVAMGAMALALIAFMLMSFFKKKVLPPSLSSHAWLMAAKWAAGIATAAAAVATAMGVVIMTTYGQQMQGMLWTAVGGIFTAIAAYSWYSLYTNQDLNAADAASKAAQPYTTNINQVLQANPGSTLNFAASNPSQGQLVFNTPISSTGTGTTFTGPAGGQLVGSSTNSAMTNAQLTFQMPTASPPASTP